MNNSVIDQQLKLPRFPQFVQLSFDLRDDFNRLTSDLQAYADYSFANLVIWLNCNSDLEISTLNQNVILRFTNILELGQPKTYTLLGTNKVDASIKELKGYLLNTDGPRILYAVPEETAKAIQDFVVEEDRDSFDYILSVDEQIHLLGSRFGKYRRKVNGFIKDSGDMTVIKELDLSNEDSFNELINAMHTWERMYDVGGNDVERIEAIALTNTLKYHNELNFRCVCIFINDQIEAFTLFRVDKERNIANINHTKCSYRHRHIFDFTVFATASKLQTENITKINFEQDLGISGLREHKLGLRPTSFLKKYTVYLEGPNTR